MHHELACKVTENSCNPTSRPHQRLYTGCEASPSWEFSPPAKSCWRPGLQERASVSSRICIIHYKRTFRRCNFGCQPHCWHDIISPDYFFPYTIQHFPFQGKEASSDPAIPRSPSHTLVPVSGRHLTCYESLAGHLQGLPVMGTLGRQLPRHSS